MAGSVVWPLIVAIHAPGGKFLPVIARR